MLPETKHDKAEDERRELYEEMLAAEEMWQAELERDDPDGELVAKLHENYQQHRQNYLTHTAAT